MEHKCRDCKEILTDDNWNKWLQMKKDYICNHCLYLRRKAKGGRYTRPDLYYKAKAKEKIESKWKSQGEHCAHCTQTDKEVIELHHLTDEIKGKKKYNWFYISKLKDEDYELVCANCHTKTHGKNIFNAFKDI